MKPSSTTCRQKPMNKPVCRQAGHEGSMGLEAKNVEIDVNISLKIKLLTKVYSDEFSYFIND